jgi:hypothetical protein
MEWCEIRRHHPAKWLLLEAISAHSVNDQRILDDLAVINIFSRSSDAMEEYLKLHRQSPDKELYVFHTSRPELNIAERRWLGIRV